MIRVLLDEGSSAIFSEAGTKKNGRRQGNDEGPVKISDNHPERNERNLDMENVKKRYMNDRITGSGPNRSIIGHSIKLP